MKKFTFCIVLVFAITTVYSQISITSEHVPDPGVTIVMSSDDDPSGIDPGAPGPDQTWDFSGLVEDETETTKYFHPSNTPYPNFFPESNLSMTADDTLYSYTTLDASAWMYLGIACEVEGTVSYFDFEPDMTIASFPVAYGDQLTQAYYYEMYGSFGDDSVRYKTNVTMNSDIDAWGSVTIPGGTYEALRAKIDQTQTDSVWFKFGGSWVLKEASVTSDNTYSWYTDHPSVGIELVTIYYEEGWTTMGEVDYFKDSFVGTGQQPELVDASVFPNPASDYLEVELGENNSGLFRIYDFSGRMLVVEEISTGACRVDISWLQAGSYIYRFTHIESGSVGSGEFIVVK